MIEAITRQSLEQKDKPKLSMKRSYRHSQWYTEPGRVKDTFQGYLKEIDGRVLDAGCSTGETTIELSNIYPNSHIYGVDNNPELIGLANENLDSRPNRDSLKVSFHHGDFYRLKDILPSNKFGVAFAMNNWLFASLRLSDEENGFIARQFNYVLSEGGLLFLSKDNKSHLMRKEGHFKAIFRKSGLGFEEVHVDRELSYENGCDRIIDICNSLN
jgi:SAM-dependent methyltransferase